MTTIASGLVTYYTGTPCAVLPSCGWTAFDLEDITMLLSTIALLAVVPATTVAPAVTPQGRGVGPITATYHVNRKAYCIRSGWTSASFATSRRIRAGDCGNAAEWRRRGITFDQTAVP
jgi:hypothetical protein